MLGIQMRIGEALVPDSHTDLNPVLVTLEEIDGARRLGVLMPYDQVQAIIDFRCGVLPLLATSFKDIINFFGAELAEAHIVEIRENEYIAMLAFKIGSGSEFRVETNTGNAIVLATTFDVPITVAEPVFERYQEWVGKTDERELFVTLNDELEYAVKSENYEEASRLQQEIRKLESS